MTLEIPDFLIIGGTKTPGRAVVSDGDEVRGWEEAAAAGATGASLKWKGDPLIEWTVTVQIWTEEQKNEWDALRRTTLKRTAPGSKPKVYVVEHPQVNDLEVDKVVVTSCTQMALVDESGLWEAKFKIKQYRPPKPAVTGKPTTAANADGTKSTPTAKDEADKMIEDLEGQVGQAKKELAEAERTYKENNP